MSDFKIYHNPRCSKSRQTLDLLEKNGVTAEIIEYLTTPPSVKELTDIINLLKISPQDLMRKKEVEYKAAGLDDLGLPDDEQIKRLQANPKVIERPIVLAHGQAVIGRPPENVLKLLTP